MRQVLTITMVLLISACAAPLQILSVPYVPVYSGHIQTLPPNIILEYKPFGASRFDGSVELTKRSVELTRGTSHALLDIEFSGYIWAEKVDDLLAITWDYNRFKMAGVATLDIDNLFIRVLISQRGDIKDVSVGGDIEKGKAILGPDALVTLKKEVENKVTSFLSSPLTTSTRMLFPSEQGLALIGIPVGEVFVRGTKGVLFNMILETTCCGEVPVGYHILSQDYGFALQSEISFLITKNGQGIRMNANLDTYFQ